MRRHASTRAATSAPQRRIVLAAGRRVGVARDPRACRTCCRPTISGACACCCGYGRSGATQASRRASLSRRSTRRRSRLSIDRRAGAGTAARAPPARAGCVESSPGCVWPRSGERMGPGTTALTRSVGRVLPLVGRARGERRDARLGHGIAAPVRARLLAAVVEREDRRWRRATRKQRQQRARQAHRRGDVDAQQRQPRIERLMLDRAQRAQHRGGVHERVEPPESALQARSHVARNRRRVALARSSGRIMGSGWPAATISS